MDYYGSSASRPRSSYRGGGSYRGASDSYRGTRGSRGSGRGGYYSRGRGGSATSSYYPPPKYESSPKYSSEGSKYGSSRAYSGEGSYTRRPESSYSNREHHDDLSRKRIRNDSYSPSQGLYSRRDEDDYRSAGRYSGGHSESRTYEESRPFKKPRPAEYKSPKDDYRVKEPLRVRPSRGRLVTRGIITRRGRDSFGSRFRGSFRSRGASATASTSEILAIRRAKLLQNRLKAESSEKAKTEEKEKVANESGGVIADPEKTLSDMGEEKNESTIEAEPERTTYYGKPFVKLICPQCSMRCITFKEYSAHLYSPTHVKAMKQKSDDLKTTLASMRIAQREKQKIIDAEDLTSMATRSFFCLICKLNCMQDKETHRATDLHNKLKKFLMPYCRTCRLSFQSPMSHETHICSLDHIRRKHAEEEREKRLGTGVLDKFMILDSVEGGDEVDEKEEEMEQKPESEPEAKEEDLTLGAEFIRTVKVKYCEVCRAYLQRLKDTEMAIKAHCRTKEHLRCYLHYGNETLLEKMQEKHEDDAEEKKKLDDAKVDAKDDAHEEALEGDELWAGLGKLLDESQPNDDEDEEEVGRFDRFKTNEKKENGDVSPSNEPEKDEKNGDDIVQEAAAQVSA